VLRYAAVVQPSRVAPYFVLAAAIHAVAVATRFADLAAKLPAGADTAIMVAQMPLILLSGYFEGRLDYGPQLAALPLWMRIRSTPVKLAFTTAFIYITVVAAQTFHVSLGPADPAAPASFGLQQRVVWFVMFTAGFFAIYYFAACGLFIPILRAVTRPLRGLPVAAGALLALAIGGAAGIGLLALATRRDIPAFFDDVHAAAARSPMVFLAVFAASLALPWLLGVIVARLDRDG
jgi:hypothetical protein